MFSTDVMRFWKWLTLFPCDLSQNNFLGMSPSAFSFIFTHTRTSYMHGLSGRSTSLLSCSSQKTVTRTLVTIIVFSGNPWHPRLSKLLNSAKKKPPKPTTLLDCMNNNFLFTIKISVLFLNKYLVEVKLDMKCTTMRNDKNFNKIITC